MEDRRFDALARALASGSSRRNVLKGLLGLGGASLGAAAVLSAGTGGSEAARRPTPTPQPIKCPGKQVPVNGVCTCPDGHTKCGPDCCPAGKAECCDGACCYGTCYGEELCCPTGHLVCEGKCVAECCTSRDCPTGWSCDSQTHVCICIPNCSGRECGDDGCGGSCGSCDQGEACVEGTCQCVPQCAGRECGDDSCGGTCGTCPTGSSCDSYSNQCICDPVCFGRECGDDQCGGSCGMCDQNEICVEGNCQCVPQCDGRECGNDTCGGSCGSCEPDEVCSSGQCIVCTPVCTEPNGDDGCGGTCPGCDEESGTHCESDGLCHCIQLKSGAFVWADDLIEMPCEMPGCPYDFESQRRYECVNDMMCFLACDCSG